MTRSRQSNLTSIVHTLLQFQVNVKIYHWQTFSYSRHKSSDSLYQNLLDLIDEFVETYMGQFDTRVRINSSNNNLRLQNITDKQIVSTVKKFRSFLQRLEKSAPFLTSDLLNLRDELLAVVDRYLYLFTLK